MISGVHIAVQSTNDAADKAFFAKVLKLPFVDAGNGRLIFAAPAADIMMHESDKNSVQQLFLMCEDMNDFLAAMDSHNIAYSPPVNRGWGTVTEITLPGGGKLSAYQPHHKRPKTASAKKPRKKPAKRKAAKPKAKTRR